MTRCLLFAERDSEGNSNIEDHIKRVPGTRLRILAGGARVRPCQPRAPP